ncbi:MAG: 6-bladed beta-propeller [Nitrospirales bacterium]|nr:6-bladed beta-propeller [Nitrospirales bacterium]
MKDQRQPIKKLTLAFSAVFAALLVSCAPTVEKKTYDIVWPLPPEQPRIKFVETLRSVKDIETSSGGFASALFGEEVAASLYKPYGVAVTKDEKIYVTDVGKVFVFDKKNKSLSFLGVEPGMGRLRIPIGVAVASDGRVFVTDTASDRVFIYDAKGNFQNAIGHEGEFVNPSGLAIDEERGRLYVTDTRKHNLRAYSLKDYSLIFDIGERGEETGQFNFPTNIALDREGKIFVTDTNNFRVQVLGPDGNFVKVIGKAGDRPGSFARPKGIAMDSEGHVYVVDAAFQNFQIFDKEGGLLLFIGEGGSEPGQFSLPAGIAVDDEDRIYVVDQLNSRVQVFQYLGEKWQKRHEAAPAPVPEKK